MENIPERGGPPQRVETTGDIGINRTGPDIQMEEPNGESDGVSEISTTSRMDLNNAIPTAILGGLSRFNREQMNDPQLWNRVIEAMRVNQELADQMRIMREGEGDNPSPAAASESDRPHRGGRKRSTPSGT